MAGKGADVALNFLKSEREAEEAAREIEGLGSRCVTVRADVSRSGAVLEMVKTITAALGPVQILVNNAGAIRPQAVQDISETDWDDMIRTNLTSAFLVTQAVLPDMRAQRWGTHRQHLLGGRAARRRGRAALCRLQGGSDRPDALLRQPAGQGGDHGQRDRPGADRDRDGAQNPNARPDLIPVGRFGTVEEVADAVLMLAGNGYITGQTINVNGGWYMS